MSASICTVFEDHYHKGVAVLINSLYNWEFRGHFYAGYRGDLPTWANAAEANNKLNWIGAKTLRPAEGLQIHFLPIETEFHLAHYKPTFMLRLLNGPANEATALAYFDPDIVNLCKWSFYEKWMSFGVAMVHEIVSNDMPLTHPTRMQWYNIIKDLNREPKRQILSYINCGFCGVSRKHIEFLKVWSEIIQVAVKDYQMDAATFIAYDRTTPFYSIDQDAFNIAAMCCESPISEMGPEAMDFVGSGWTMSHATGSPKPWNRNFILSAMNGIPPSRTDKLFWDNTLTPLLLYKKIKRLKMKFIIKLSAFISRFYNRN